MCNNCNSEISSLSVFEIYYDVYGNCSSSIELKRMNGKRECLEIYFFLFHIELSIYYNIQSNLLYRKVAHDFGLVGGCPRIFIYPTNYDLVDFLFGKELRRMKFKPLDKDLQMAES